MIGLIIATLLELIILYNIRKPSKMLFWEFYLCLFSFSLVTILKAPSFIYYFMDLNNSILFLNILLKCKKDKIIHKNSLLILIFTVLFLGIGSLISLANKNSIGLIIWSLRTYTRYIIIFWATLYFWKDECTNKLFKTFFPILIINAVISIYQYKLNIYSTDCIGGILGNNYGVNGYSIFFFMITVGYFLDAYINKKEKLFNVIVSIISIFICVIVADLKVFYFIFIIELTVIMLVNKIRLRHILLLLLMILMTLVIYNICISFYKSINIFDIKYIHKYLTKSSYSYSVNSINRTDGIKIINRLFDFNGFQKLFGKGLGAGEYNSFFQSSIYKQYSHIHYHWFLYAWIYLETGYIGLFLYYMIFVTMFIQFFSYVRKEKKVNFYINIALAILPVISIMMIYNSAMKGDGAYIVFILLGIAYKDLINRREKNNEFKV